MAKQEALPTEWYQPIDPNEKMIQPSDIRDDVSYQLGERLTARENRVYLFLLNQGGNYTPTGALYDHFWSVPGLEVAPSTKVDFVSVPISKIRKKLGETSIITKWGSGYVTRRGLILSKVASNPKNPSA